MLTASQLDTLPESIVSLYSQYEESIILDICRRLGNMDFTSAAWQVQRLNESGAICENILKEISKITGKTELELRTIFQRAGVKAMRFDDAIYTAAGLNPLPLNLSPAMSQVLVAGLRKTAGIMQNMTLTTALSGQDAFINAADLAYMQVSSGAMSYTEAIRLAVKKVASDGISVVQYFRHTEQLDVAVRRATLTGISQTVGKLQEARADELGQDLVQTSAHAGARPEHEVWQGNVFSRSGTNSKYPDFVESTGYGTGTGLMGWNCRHSFFPFFEGISQNAYDQEMLNDLESKTVTFRDKEMTLYEGTQYQRGVERKIRFWKRQANSLEVAKQENSFETAKVKQWQGRMREFIQKTGLQRQREREIIIN